MKLSISFIIMAIILSSCQFTSQDKPMLPDARTRDLSNTEHYDTTIGLATKGVTSTASDVNSVTDRIVGKSVLISSGQFLPFTTVNIRGCKFDLVIKNNDTIYLATADQKFQTPEGYQVGMKLAFLPENIQSKLVKEPGWGYYYHLPSGWALGFCEGNSCTENFPKNPSKVKWIFKRKSDAIAYCPFFLPLTYGFPFK